MNNESTGKRGTAAAVFACLLFLLLHSAYSARINSVTADEYVHLPVGISILETGSFFMDHTGSPPMRAVAALPALLHKPVMDYDSRWWTQKRTYQFSWSFLRNNFDRYHQLFFLPRMAIAFFALFLGALVFYYAKSLHGAWVAVAAVFLLCFNPEILAHGSLVTSDLLVACFFLRLFIPSPCFSARPDGPAVSCAVC